MSIVPNSASPRSAASRTPSTFSSTHCSLPPEKYVAGGSRPSRRTTSPRPSRSSCRAIRSVRVSCQTMALEYGRPVRAVPDDGGLALVGDADRRQVARREALRASRRAHHRDRALQDLERVVLHPAGPRQHLLVLELVAPRSLPSWSNSMNRVLVVPWSTAPMRSATSPRPLRRPSARGSACCRGVYRRVHPRHSGGGAGQAGSGRQPGEGSHAGGGSGQPGAGSQRHAGSPWRPRPWCPGVPTRRIATARTRAQAGPQST